MDRYSLTHLADGTVVQSTHALAERERGTTAEFVAYIGEMDARKLYLPAAYPSMFAYCVGELRLSESAAFNRIRAARTARQYPVVFTALADGRLHLGSVLLLAPHLTGENADDLLASAMGRSKTEIEQLLAERFPQPDVPEALIELGQLAPGRVEMPSVSAPLALDQGSNERPASLGDAQLLPGGVEVNAERPRVKPLAPSRFALQMTIEQATRDKLRHAQDLLGHVIPAGDLAAVLDRALDALIEKLEKRKLAATDKPRSPVRKSPCMPRHIPAHVKRAVWQRDQGQCTFVSATGKRCEAGSRLEFDHVQEVARGGEACVSNLRLRCRAHNQYAAERAFGAEFMRHKRNGAAEARAAVKACGPEAAGTRSRAYTATTDHTPTNNGSDAVAGSCAGRQL